MGVSSKKTKTKTNETSTVAPSDYSRPYITQAADAAQPGFQAASNLVSKYTPQLEQGVNYFSNVMNERGPNPYLEEQIGNANRDAMDGVNSQFMDRFGSGYHAKTLADAIARNENDLRFGDYYRQQGRRDSAAGQQANLVGNLVGLQQQPAGANADIINSLMGRFNTQTGSSTSINKQSGGLGGILQSIALLGR